MTGKANWVIAIIVCLAVCAGANAQVITIGIEAVIDGVDDSGNYLEGKINAGDLITGFYTYDTSTLDTAPETDRGNYLHNSLSYGMSLNVGGFNFATDPANVDFLVWLGDGVLGDDGYYLRSENNLPLSNGVLVDHISWQLDDYSEQAISSTDLFAMPPVLADWPDGNRLSIRGDKLTSYFTIGAHVTSAQVIPEPATIAIFAFGLAFIGKRKKTN